jgi:hypothetical protein
MQTAMEIVFIGLSLFVIVGACFYGRGPQIQVLGVFLSDGTRIDRPMRQAYAAAPVARHTRISVAGPGSVDFSDSGLVVTGPARVTING